MVPLSRKATLYAPRTLRSFNNTLNIWQIALKNDMDYPTTLGQLREARKQGLTAPVLLMGTYSVPLSSSAMR